MNQQRREIICVSKSGQMVILMVIPKFTEFVRCYKFTKCPNSALRGTAEEYGDQYDTQIPETIQTNMYVEDCLVSAEYDERAVLLIKKKSKIPL